MLTRMNNTSSEPLSCLDSYKVVRFLADELGNKLGGPFSIAAAGRDWRHGCRTLFRYDETRAHAFLQHGSFASYTHALPNAGGDSLQLRTLGVNGCWQDRAYFSFVGSYLKHGNGELKVWAGDPGTAQQVLSEIMLELDLRPPDRKSHAQIGHIYWAERDTCMVTWEFAPIIPTALDYELGIHYGPDVAEWMRGRLAVLATNGCADITFVSGGTGTGKTRLLRRIGQSIAATHAMLAVSADDLVRVRSVTEFWSTVYPGDTLALIAVEDAETCLADRDRRGPRLLRLLSQMGYGWMHRRHIICTLNAESPADALALLPARWHPFEWRHLERHR
jgi:hypothetical protein